MPLNRLAVRENLRAFRFSDLFTQPEPFGLGWDHPDRHPSLQVVIRTDGGNRAFNLTPVAHKRDVVAYHCPIPADAPFPDSSIRHKIETEVAKRVLEHVILFTDAGRTQVILQTAIRRPGVPVRRPEYHFDIAGSGEVLLQRLDRLVFTLEQEEALTVVDVVQRLQSATNAEKVTKKFYDTFAKERQKFTEFVSGIRSEGDRAWYASVMLNRLMFVYFIQAKGFLNSELEYLPRRLARVQELKGKNHFHSFYRSFLLRLFHDGLGKRESERKFDPALKDLIGRVPYLNGGLFEVHDIEKAHDDGRAITIPDEAFDRLFRFFGDWRWHLDERPLRDEREINPDVLGYIFEKYINQKQMGAYYTKEDITDYISKNCVIPWLFQRVERALTDAVDRAAFSSWWQGLLRASPDSFIYPSVRHGVSWDHYTKRSLDVERPLPPEIAKGLDTTKPRLIERRKDWQKSAPPEFALPTEIWREVVARRQRYTEVRRHIEGGEVKDIADFIALNLDIRQFTQDAIARCPESKWLRHFWNALQEVTILDPTCGSGAFLFAALNLLLPLYEGVLQRMDDMLRDADLPVPTAALGDTIAPAEKPTKTFQRILGDVNDPARHPTRRYFVLKEIVLRNLYGVDFMPEAVEICKLRLFLKLVAQVEPDTAKDNLGVEPLPDVDFNVRPGNTLVGFATRQELEAAFGTERAGDLTQAKMIYGEDSAILTSILEAAEDSERLFDTFRKTQEKDDPAGQHEVKTRLKASLDELRARCDRALAEIYEPELSTKSKKFATWRETHQPFHWYIEFYGIMRRGGFAAIIGNPPYIVLAEGKMPYRLRDGAYRTVDSKNLYALVFERSLSVAQSTGPVGLIVQLTAISSERMTSLQNLVVQRGQVYALPFPRRPESIFDGVEMPVVILLSLPTGQPQFHTARIGRFYTDERPVALECLCVRKNSPRLHGHRIAKFGRAHEASILNKVLSSKPRLESQLDDTGRHAVFYQEACRYWLKSQVGLPYFRRNGEKIPPPHGRIAYAISAEAACLASCFLNSSLFYWFYSCFSDCEHVNDALIRDIPLPPDWEKRTWQPLYDQLAADLLQNATKKSINTKQGHTIDYLEMNAALSKNFIDEIDRALADHFAFTEEELDFIINYDIKYRLGAEATAAEDN
jgi:hypothetical protein